MTINWMWPEETKQAAIAFAQTKFRKQVVDVKSAGTGLWFWVILDGDIWVKLVA